MRAAQIKDYGDTSVIHIDDIDIPKVSDDKVLVEAHASSLNPFDSKLRSGVMKETFPIQLPFTLGGDIAGVVLEVGKEVSGIAVGDDVYGQAAAVAGNSGALADFVVTNPQQLSKMPSNLDFNQAASLPLVGVSALQALTTHIGLQSGQKLFIHGGAGGIGMVAIQIAKHIGAYVATTASDENLALVKEIGADEVIDYKTTDFSEALTDFDAVFDTVGGEDFNKSLHILKNGGIAVSMAGQADEGLATQRGVQAISQSTHVTTEQLGKLTEFIEAGVVTPHVDTVFPLNDIVKAFESRESSAIKGKIVIQIR